MRIPTAHEPLSRLRRSNFLLRISVVFVSVVFVSMVAIAGILLRFELHISEHANDYDFWGNHRCPKNLYPNLKNGYPPSKTRPDENALWENVLKSAKEEDEGCQKKGINSNEFQKLFDNKEHYIFEIRRTIYEFELGDPVNFPRTNYYWHDPQNMAHYRARFDVMHWYTKMNLLPNTFQPHHWE